jgi:NNP family nitrate/nitrite transporter-like MFS transporter
MSWHSASWIDHWEPEDPGFWQARGRRIARRNLIWSILAVNVGFSVWMLWSVVAPRLRQAGFPYSTEQLFQLVALPGLVGALVRFPYTFAVPRFGGRNWTIVSALLLLIPTVTLSILVTRPTTPFWVMALAAALAGLGGGNFASSMANISFFYPDRAKGLALGLNAAGGNIGVSTVQLIVPALLGVGAISLGMGASHGGGAGGKSPLYLQNAGLVWLPLILITAVGAFLFMDNLSSTRSSFRDQCAALKSRHTWIMSWLYIGTFGSFIGYSAAFPLLLKTQFPEVAMNLSFLGPLVGSLSRPLGGRLADRYGGTRVTLWTFVVMGLATMGAIYTLNLHAVGPFVVVFLSLFVLAGVGNGSTFRMVPVIFRHEAMRARAGIAMDGETAALIAARRNAAAVLGLTSAVGACGGYFIPRTLGASIAATGGVTLAFGCFLGFYASCIFLTWWCYARPAFAAYEVSSLARARLSA